jgi:membrane associated rhomboid family serine protease
VIPISDDNRGVHRPPIVTIGLILANIAVFIYQLTLAGKGGGELERFILSFGVTPYELRNLEDIRPLIDYPVWVTVFTSMFMHGGWLHLGGNMLFLWIFGDNVEDAMGHVRFLLFYLLAGIGAVALQVALTPNSLTPMVGASGAISGVLAGYLLLFPGSRVNVLVFLGFFVTVFALPALVVIGFWIVLQFLNGYATLGPETQQTGGVAYWAHVGGFAMGLLTVFLFRDRRARGHPRRIRNFS